MVKSRRNDDRPRSAGRRVAALALALAAATAPTGGCSDDKDAAEPRPVEGGPGASYARAAVVLASCLPAATPGPDRSSLVLIELAYLYKAVLPYGHAETKLAPNPRAAELVACLAASTRGCAALETCLGRRIEPADRAVPCEPTCDGTTYRGCGSVSSLALYYRETRDCAREGLACSVTQGCGPPADPAPPSCVKDTKYPRCDGATPVYCATAYNREERYAPCDADAVTCVVESSSGYEFARCQGTGAPCKSGYKSRCEGRELRACINRHEGPRVACTALGEGFSCVDNEDNASCGLARLPENVSSFKVPRCEGTKLLLWNAGRLDAVDCATLGFSSCNPERKTCAPGFGG